MIIAIPFEQSSGARWISKIEVLYCITAKDGIPSLQLHIPMDVLHVTAKPSTQPNPVRHRYGLLLGHNGLLDEIHKYCHCHWHLMKVKMDQL